MPPTLYLIDGHALAYRTYFALSSTGGQRWHTSSGEPTAGIYGFATVLMRLLEERKARLHRSGVRHGQDLPRRDFPRIQGHARQDAR